MSLEYEELTELSNKILDFVSKQILKMNQQNELDEYLIKIGFKEIKEDNLLINKEKSKILIIGESSIKEKDIVGIFKEYGISKTRIEAVLDYEHAKKYNYSNLQWNYNYGVILLGPIPHSTDGKNSSSSIITEIENDNGYPKSVRLTANSKLKITKHNLKEVLEELIADGIIYQNLY